MWNTDTGASGAPRAKLADGGGLLVGMWCLESQTLQPLVAHTLKTPWTFTTLCGSHRKSSLWGRKIKGEVGMILQRSKYLDFSWKYLSAKGCSADKRTRICYLHLAWSFSSMSAAGNCQLGASCSCKICWGSPFPHATALWIQGFTPKPPWEYLIYQKVLTRHLLLAAQTSQTFDGESHPLKLYHAG